MQIEYLKAFCTVYKEKSFAQAARKLNISTPKMTRQIQQLEQELGVKLLHRSTRALNSTEAGEIFYQQAHEILQQYDATVAAVHNLGESVAGTLKIGAPASISQLWIAPTIHKLTEKYPNLEIRLVLGNHLLDLLSDRFDIILHCSTLPSSDYYFQKLHSWRKITCAAPTYLKKHGTPDEPKHLQQHNCLDHFDSNTGTWGYKIDNSKTDIAVRGSMQANSSITLKELALAGSGIVYLPSFTVADALQNGTLIEVLSDYRLDDYEIYAVYPAKKQSSKKLQVVLEYLEEVIP